MIDDGLVVVHVAITLNVADPLEATDHREPLVLNASFEEDGTADHFNQVAYRAKTALIGALVKRHWTNFCVTGYDFGQFHDDDFLRLVRLILGYRLSRKHVVTCDCKPHGACMEEGALPPTTTTL